MAKTYKFLSDDGTTDVELLSESIGDNTSGFVTEVRGLNVEEVAKGFNYGINQYSEAEFAAFADTEDLTIKVYENGVFKKNLADTANILTFTLEDQTGEAVIDAAAKTVDIEVAAETVVTALVATFTLSSSSTAKIGATAQVSGVTANNFTAAKSYVVTSPLGKVETWTVTVTIAS